MQDIENTGRKCPICGNYRKRHAVWLDGEKIFRGCNFCHMDYVKKKKGNNENTNNDDII